MLFFCNASTLDPLKTPNWLEIEANSILIIVRKERGGNVYVVWLITDNYSVGVRLGLEIKGLRGN